MAVTIGMLAALADSGSVAAQPQLQPPPQLQPQPQQQPWYRFTLVDGRVLDVQIVGGDAATYHIQTGGAVYSVPRVDVVSAVALAAPVVYTAPPAPEVAQPAPQSRDMFDRNPRAAGLIWFGTAYLTTAAIALARRDNDKDANAGLVPVFGPFMWAAANDADDLFEDGWDWLGAFDMILQGGGLYIAITGGKDKDKDKKTATKPVTLAPFGRRGVHGLSLSGSF